MSTTLNTITSAPILHRVLSTDDSLSSTSARAFSLTREAMSTLWRCLPSALPWFSQVAIGHRSTGRFVPKANQLSPRPHSSTTQRITQ